MSASEREKMLREAVKVLRDAGALVDVATSFNGTANPAFKLANEIEQALTSLADSRRAPSGDGGGDK